MANFFSLYDGNLTDPAVYGYSLSSGEVMNNTSGVSIPSDDISYTPTFISDGSNINGIALHLSSIRPYTSDTIALKANVTTNESTIVDVTNNSLVINNSAYVVTDTPFDPNMSGSFTTTTSYITIPNNSQTAFRDNNFTIEFWYLSYGPSDNITRPIYVNYDTGFAINNIFIGKHTSNSGKMCVYLGSISTSSPVLSDPNILPSGWNHWTLTRNNNTFTLYQNGSSVATYTHSSSISSTAATNIGSIGYNGYNSNGIISNFRIINGTCLYTDTFTPSATSLTNINNTALLTLQNEVAKDNSSNNISLTANNVRFVNNSPLSTNGYSPTINGGSVYLPLSSYLQFPVSNYTKFSTNPFTFELWFKTNTQNNDVCLFSNQNGSTGTSIILNKQYYGTIVTDSYAFNSTQSSLHPTPELSSYRIPVGGYIKTNTNGYSIHPFGADGTSNFTIQWWSYVPSGQAGTTQSYPITWDMDYRGIRVYHSIQPSPNQSLCYITILIANSDGTAWQYAKGTTILISYNTWTHFSVIRSGDVVKVYKNGVAGDTKTLTSSSIYCGPDYYGYQPRFSPGLYMGVQTQCIAYYAGIRMVSEALDATVPTAPYEVTPTTVCLLNAPYDYTFKRYGNYPMIGRLDVYNGTTPIHTLSAASNNYLDSKWHHLALTRDSNGSRIFIDGYQQGSTNATQGSTNFDGSSQASWYIGKSTSSNIDNIATYSPYEGYVSNIRALTGRSLYTSYFVPSTTVFTNILNTSLLVNNTNYIGYKTKFDLGTYNISSFSNYDGSNNTLTNHPQNWQIIKFNTPLTSLSGELINFELSASNNNQISLISAPLTAKEISINNLNYYFNGNSCLTSFKPYNNFTNSVFVSGYSNYLSIPNSTKLDFTYKDFTIECWFNSVSSQADGTIFSRWGDGSNNFALFTRIASNNALLLYINSSLVITGPTISYNTWYHVAVVRTNSIITLYLNGILVGNPYYIGSSIINNGNTNIYLGRRGDVNSGMIGYINDFRITNGSAIYKSKFTPPIQPLTVDVNTVFLLRSVLNLDKAVLKQNTNTPILSDTIHIGGSLTGVNTEPRTITASTSTFQNLYIHNRGNLNFPLTSGKTLTLNGSAGLQITSDGTLNIGTSSSSIPLSTTHTIILSNTQIDVHNGGNLNIYGYPKTISTYLSSDTISGSRTFTTTNEISSSWIVGDSLYFIPNITQLNSSEIITVSSFIDSNVFNTSVSSIYTHPSLSSVSYIPTINNLSRNVIIKGTNSTNRASIRSIDAGKTYINYALLSNFGIDAINKNGLIIANNSNGIISLCGSVINMDNYVGVNWFSFLSGRNPYSALIKNNILLKPNNGLILSSISPSGSLIIDNNLILSSNTVGMYLDSLSSSNLIITNNKIIGSLTHGMLYTNNNLSSNYNNINYRNIKNGTYLSGTNKGIIQNINIYSGNEGVYVDATTSNLSSVIFANLTANNNSSAGFKISGNNLSYSTPLVINITNSEMSNNSGAGIEAYNITGTFSGLAVNNNLNYGIKTSIGNGVTLFDKLTSITPTYTPSSDVTSQSLVILSGYNYNKTSIRNSILSASSTNPAASASVALSIDSTRFSEFSLENTILSAGIPLKLAATRNLLEGSYLFNNCLVGNTPLGSGITNIYQPTAIRSAGFAFTSINKINGNHVTYFVAGQRMLDYVTPSVTLSDAPSEKLIPSSTSIKLRSGSKYIALNKSESTTVSVYARKSIIDDGSVYNGNDPRLILVRNPSMGVYNDVIIDTLSLSNDLSGSFVQLIGISPTVTDNGVLEYYVDCDGTTGWLNIDKWEVI